jgi:basic amino acid/polyamine antiporter, APA family
VYYAIANASALTLGQSRSGTALAALGLVGCLVLAVTLPWRSAVAGFTVLVLGALWYGLRHMATGRSSLR